MPNHNANPVTQRLTALLLSVLIAACNTQSVKPKDDGVSEVSLAAQIQQLFRDIAESSPDQQPKKQIQVAALLLEAGQLDLAKQTLQALKPDALSTADFAAFTKVSAEISLLEGDYQRALQILESPRLLSEIELLPLPEQSQLNRLRADVYGLLGDHIASARQRVYLDPFLPANSEDINNQQQNREALWHSLMQLSADDLQRYTINSLEGEFRGWLQLAIIAKNNQSDLDKQVQQLESWQQFQPTHPANQQLPGGLALLRELAASRPQQVALLLPLSGKLAGFGKAVRDGFIAALYESRSRGAKVPLLKIYDTDKLPIAVNAPQAETATESTATDTSEAPLATNTGEAAEPAVALSPFMQLYQQAVSEGAELIVGPLQKQHLTELFDSLELPVPTLALNRINDYGESPALLYQFGLAPQDEARQVAEIAALANHQQAMVIAPDSDWGNKVSTAFQQHWQQLGGTTLATSLFSQQQDYSDAIKVPLLLNQSENRAKRIQQLIGESVEFTPRRRQDVDMIFMLARPQQARSLNPLLAFHFAGDLPVYGTSRLYSGYPNPAKDGDINGIRFTDMPWVLNPDSKLQQKINEEIANSKNYQRMYALGIDSFQLHPRLRQLQQIKTSRVFGQTGTLKLNDNNQVERQVLFAEIKNSLPEVSPVANRRAE